ncbi:MAG TPA: YlxR family protein [Syntrophomonas sp.]|nr:YlxR family protein [Syntrophomonas sp.]HPT69783.1 YlxR family protein [Syntrophomonas sp.]
MAKVRKIPQRMCVGCREMKNKRDLLRVVRTPEGSIEVDPTGKKSGRGAYLCPDPECLTQAVKGKRLQKALEHEISNDILDIIRAQLKI